MPVNTLDSFAIIPSGKALCAEIRGVDFSDPVPDEIRDAIMDAWAEHLVLLFRGQSLDDDQLLRATAYFGGQHAAGSRNYFVKAGYNPVTPARWPHGPASALSPISAMMEAPKTRDDITGPVHPIVRVTPLTDKRALFLGRYYEFSSSHIVELNDEDS